ncbi:hypothetical protein E2562_009860 [Oryza meyeriana var. granulata]|uniref:Replication protein A OB domain-containing protein n=1 Tax=Oryza meyeriana var. granulata TaxID=110450 RepID=A0A6G1BUL1_9ORYZ|nr:hypothetical protein E2562_009860 [Oryza meyeriana var. granulata]
MNSQPLPSAEGSRVEDYRDLDSRCARIQGWVLTAVDSFAVRERRRSGSATGHEPSDKGTRSKGINRERTSVARTPPAQGRAPAPPPTKSVLNVALWGECATSFLADEVFAAGQKEPQIVIFVGTLVRGYGDISLSDSSAYKWCTNVDTPKVNSLKNSIQGSYELIKWIDLPPAAAAHSNAEPKSIAQIKDLNPFKFKW